MTDHTCTAADGTPITLGAIFFNNNLEPVKITEEPRHIDNCDGAGHGATNLPGNCWWGTEDHRGNRAGQFDGSRLTSTFRFRDRGLLTAFDAFEELRDS